MLSATREKILGKDSDFREEYTPCAEAYYVHERDFLPERCGGVKFLFRAFYQDGAVGQGEGHASDVRVIKGLPTVRLVSHYLHPLQYSAKILGAAVQAGVAPVGGVEAGVAGVAGVGTDGGVKARVRLTIQGEVQSVKLRDEVANVPLRAALASRDIPSNILFLSALSFPLLQFDFLVFLTAIVLVNLSKTTSPFPDTSAASSSSVQSGT